MPLRDHFRPPVENRHSWDELHGGWPMVIVQQLFTRNSWNSSEATTRHWGHRRQFSMLRRCADESARAGEC